MSAHIEACNEPLEDVVKVWLLKRGSKKPPAMYDAIYAVPGVSDGHNPQRSTPLSQSIDYHAFGKLITLSCELEAQVAELKEGDIGEALRLQAEVNKLDAMIAKRTPSKAVERLFLPIGGEKWLRQMLTLSLKDRKSLIMMEPLVRIELTTYSLRVKLIMFCSGLL